MSTSADNDNSPAKDTTSGQAPGENCPPKVAPTPRIKATRNFSPPFNRAVYECFLDVLRNGESQVPSSRELRCFGFNSSRSISPRQKFRLILPRLQIKSVDGSLVFSANSKQDVLITKSSRKILLPVEDAEKAIKRAHFTGSNNSIGTIADETKHKHIDIKKTLNVLTKVFTTNRRDFGINKLLIKKIVDNCQSCAFADISFKKQLRKVLPPKSTVEQPNMLSETCTKPKEITEKGTVVTSRQPHLKFLGTSTVATKLQPKNLPGTSNVSIKPPQKTVPGMSGFATKMQPKMVPGTSSVAMKLQMKIVPGTSSVATKIQPKIVQGTANLAMKLLQPKALPVGSSSIKPKSKIPRFSSMVAQVPDTQCIWYGRDNIARATNRFTKLLLVINEIQGDMAVAFKGDVQAKQRLDTKLYVALVLIRDYKKVLEKSLNDYRDFEMIPQYLEILRQEYTNAGQESIFISDLQNVVSGNNRNMVVQQIENFIGGKNGHL